jgi:hypothetical protein
VSGNFKSKTSLWSVMISSGKFDNPKPNFTRVKALQEEIDGLQPELLEPVVEEDGEGRGEGGIGQGGDEPAETSQLILYQNNENYRFEF